MASRKQLEIENAWLRSSIASLQAQLNVAQSQAIQLQGQMLQVVQDTMADTFSAAKDLTEVTLKATLPAPFLPEPIEGPPIDDYVDWTDTDLPPGFNDVEPTGPAIVEGGPGEAELAGEEY